MMAIAGAAVAGLGPLVSAVGQEDAGDTTDRSAQSPWEISRDPVALLAQRIASGAVKLVDTSEQAFLTSVLRELDVPVASQVLVFSKTSLQKALIGPARPRAIYFNEETYVGWVQGGDLELMSTDPVRGPRYYLVARPFVSQSRPSVVLGNACLSCHAGGNLQVQSVHTTAAGYPMGGEDRFVTTMESPLGERWGGWYVTGRHGKERHMGNGVTVPSAKGPFLDRERGANLTSLKDFISTEPYLTDTSDIVALMVLEHQYVMQNSLSEAGHAVRRTLAQHQDAPDTAAARTTLGRVLYKQGQKLVSQLLYSGEYELQDGGISGSAQFQDAFRRNRRPTPDGRSLKDFDLRSRLFQHRCSYMIYSPSFDGLPLPLKETVYRQLGDVLEGRNSSPDFAHLDAAERTQIREILWETKPEVRPFWAAPAKG
jgi:hypothetical protein